MTIPDETAAAAFVGKLFFVTALSLPLIVLILVLKLGVNIPFSDEWDWAPLLAHAQNGTLLWSQLWNQHNEHRMIVTSLLVLLLAKIHGWNLIREELFSVVLGTGTQFILWHLLRRSIRPDQVAFVFFAMSLQLWNVGQAENFAMGLQVGWMLLEFCIVLMVWLLTKYESTTLHFFIASIAAVTATFSSEIGLLAWPVGLCALTLQIKMPKIRKIRILFWVIFGVATFCLFRIGYVQVSFGHVDIAPNIISILLYAVAYLGVPVGFWLGLPACIVIGTAVLGIFIALTTYVVRNNSWRTGDLSQYAPWLALALFAILGAFGTAPNRLGLGLDSVVLSTRYILVSSWLTTAMIGLLACCFSLNNNSLSTQATWAGSLIGVICLATGISSLRGVRDWQHFSSARQADVAALRLNHLNQLAPYFAARSELMFDVSQLRMLQNGPLGQ